ncbi:MAG: hypothetical protein AB8H47_01505 [Bacteroidia bacterium]
MPDSPSNPNTKPLHQIHKEQIRKLEALFLNQIDGLHWFYFDLNLKVDGPNPVDYRTVSKKNEAWLDRIKEESNGSFKFVSAANTKEKDLPGIILEHLILFLRKYQNAPRRILQRIFDENSPSVLNQSQAEEGLMGKANFENEKDRKEEFDKRIRSKIFREKGKSILVEGDSWFQHPPVQLLGDSVKDIIDWLIEDNPNYAVYSMAAGGDWLSNMIKTTDYISMLDRISPDAFLFSGGGNDMMGGYRPAKLIRKKFRNGNFQETENDEVLGKSKARLLKLRNGTSSSNVFDEEKYKRGLKFLSLEFFNFLNITMSQYYLLVTELSNLKRFNHIKFITQGYDFAIPSPRKASRIKVRNRLLNNFMNSGRWLHDPMVLKGIFDPEDQESIAYAMVWEFNEMLIMLSEHFDNLYHIDCRGTANSEDDWFDEIHLKSHAFQKIADTFQTCIESGDKTKKVYRVVDHN